MSSKNPQHNGAKALEVSCGNITCGSVERRRLYEELGIEDQVEEFTGEAAKAGRQAEEGDYEDEESPDAEEPRDPYEEAYADE